MASVSTFDAVEVAPAPAPNSSLSPSASTPLPVPLDAHTRTRPIHPLLPDIRVPTVQPDMSGESLNPDTIDTTDATGTTLSPPVHSYDPITCQPLTQTLAANARLRAEMERLRAQYARYAVESATGAAGVNGKGSSSGPGSSTNPNIGSETGSGPGTESLPIVNPAAARAADDAAREAAKRIAVSLEARERVERAIRRKTEERETERRVFYRVKRAKGVGGSGKGEKTGVL